MVIHCHSEYPVLNLGRDIVAKMFSFVSAVSPSSAQTTSLTFSDSMLYRSLDKYLGWFLLSVLIATPVAAHTEKVSGDVGGLLHIEPHDNPQARQTAHAWIVLTRKGGQLIRLSQCKCQLAVYPNPHNESDAPLLKPPLHAVTAEQYKDIPGAEIIFSKVGTYELEFSGSPKSGANFKPFTLSYTVTVGS